MSAACFGDKSKLAKGSDAPEVLTFFRSQAWLFTPPAALRQEKNNGRPGFEEKEQLAIIVCFGMVTAPAGVALHAANALWQGEQGSIVGETWVYYAL
ncbi:hypothetical protein LJC46_02915 [Desulfovibrio sp. OttesenSCG-928-G15]|nr:hypothetical protein [Desulfovibrio sp. OttesenSCG-928-G15]